MRFMAVVGAPSTVLCERAAQSFRRFRTPLAARWILRCFIVLNYFLIHDFLFRDPAVRFLLFLCMPYPQIIIQHCLRRYNIRCVEFL